MKARIYITRRIRKSPFFECTVRAGAKEFSVYNKTYLPAGYAGEEAEFWSLVNNVTLWDVTCQRIVEITGPDAFRFTDRLTPRDLSKCKVGQCRYVLITGEDGGILNDPVLLRLDENRFWLSCADNDILMWARGVAIHAGLNVEIEAPDVAVLQLQGPNSVHVLQELIGDSGPGLPYYHLMETEIRGIPVIVSRTGWSAEHGYEIYLLDTSRGPELWDTLMEVGQPYGIAPASPSRIRRIEAGIPDFGADMSENTNPFEVGLDRLVDLNPDADYIGKAALERIKAEGITRRIAGIEIEGEPVPFSDRVLPVYHEDRLVGQMTSWVYSPRLQRNIGIAMLALSCTRVGTEITIGTDVDQRRARVVEKPFVDPQRRLAKGQ
ncbi:MAG: glycine cleavage T C-terminal barrel domain-containing protein [Alphaproteobacteria bacterium]